MKKTMADRFMPRRAEGERDGAKLGLETVDVLVPVLARTLEKGLELRDRYMRQRPQVGERHGHE
jgi:hypothetical protein